MSMFFVSGPFFTAKMFVLQQQNIMRCRKQSIKHLHQQALQTFLFPVSGWSSNRKDLSVVSALTILGHLLKTGKAKPGDNDGEVIVVQKPLNRGNVCILMRGY